MKIGYVAAGSAVEALHRAARLGFDCIELNFVWDSESDIERLHQIQRLTQDMGINLAGVEVVLNLLDRMNEMQREMEEEMNRVRQEMERQLREVMRRG